MSDVVICSNCQQEMTILENNTLFCATCGGTHQKLLTNLENFKNVDFTIEISYFFEYKKSLKGFIPKRLAEVIKTIHILKTFRDNNQILVYVNDGGIYEDFGEKLIREDVRRILGEKCNIHYVNETVAAIRETTYIDRKLFNSDNSKILLDNGILDLNTLELSPHSPEHLFTNKIPICYNPNAECPNFFRFLEEKQPSEANRKIIQEIFGYCLLKDNRLQKAFLFYGERRTGKSTILNILKKMLGIENITAMSLQFLNEDNFAMAYIYGKMANICADLSPKSLKDVGKFMMTTGEDPITIARKREHPFTFDPVTKFIFSCNTIPPTSNKDMAFYRRWCLINFNEQTKEDEIDDMLLSKLTTKEELEGILLWAIGGLKRIVSNGKLTYSLDEFQVRDLYERNSDSISSFIFNCIDEEDLEKVKKREVYKTYEKYCKDNKLKVENRILFGRVFKEVSGCGTSTIDNIPSYVGVKLKEYKKVVEKLEEYF